MKHGKKPTREQRKLMQTWGLDSNNWLVVKDTPEVMLVVHRHVNRTREVPKHV